MNSIYLAIIGLGIFYLGYKFYSSYISKHIYALDEDLKTPAHEFQDDIDYVPTKKHILFGHHYTSIAGAAPIIGPCIAAYWGWLPALAWVVLGTVFMGAVHDFGALAMSLKEKGINDFIKKNKVFSYAITSTKTLSYTIFNKMNQNPIND